MNDWQIVGVTAPERSYRVVFEVDGYRMQTLVRPGPFYQWRLRRRLDRMARSYRETK